MFDEFVQTIQKTIENYALLKKLSRCEQKLKDKPWITKGILLSIKKKKLIYKTHFYQGNDTHKLIYKKDSNKLTKVKDLSKRRYFKKEINNNRGNPRKVWELLRFVLPCSNKKSSSFPSKLQSDGVKIDNPDAILECFNSYFCNIGVRFAKNIDRSNSYDFKFFLRYRISPYL